MPDARHWKHVLTVAEYEAFLEACDADGPAPDGLRTGWERAIEWLSGRFADFERTLPAMTAHLQAHTEMMRSPRDMLDLYWHARYPEACDCREREAARRAIAESN